MAILTKTEKYAAETYAKYFGRAADYDTIKAYSSKENGKAQKQSVILTNIRQEADIEKALDTTDFVNNSFQSLFGRDATTKEMNKYSKVIEKGKNLPINSIVKSVAKAYKDVYNNKKAVALKYAELGGKGDLDLSEISKGNLVDLKTVFNLTDLTNAIAKLEDNSGIPSSFDGKTFVLTESVDTIKGTNKDDLFIADNSSKINASAVDTLDGGKGTDTFKLYDTTDAAATTNNIGSLPTLKNIENVVIYDNVATPTAAVDLTKWDTVETLFLVRSGNTTGGYKLGEKVTTVNLEDTAAAATPILNFDAAVAAATLGVNKVGTATVTVDSGTTTAPGTALKTLTINASGKELNNVTLNQTAATIETLNITGKADLTLVYGTGLTAITTVDGSKAQGDLTLTKTATMTSVKTGSGDDIVTIAADGAAANVAFGHTIDLGAGNDKLEKGAGTVAAGSIIDGGAGIDSLDADLVTVGNEGVFASFEIISLNAANNTKPLDLDLLTKSTITSIAKDQGNAHALTNVKKSQALTINTSSATATTLNFKASEVAGKADAYTININADSATGTFDAGTVSVEKIETVIVNSLGKNSSTTDINKITLQDANAKSLVITGDKNIELVLGTTGNAFGTANTVTGEGVATIDASASTAGIKITDLANTAIGNLNVAAEGLTIKGGSGDDDIKTDAIVKANIATLTIDSGAGNDILDLGDIAEVAAGLTKADINVNAGAGNDEVTVGAVGGTFTLGTGKDTIDVIKATVGTIATTVATGAIKTTITDIEKGDQIVFHATASNLFAKATISGANNLDEALGLAATGTGANTTWFQYGSKTYIVHNDTTTALSTGDIVVELNGVFDLGNSELAAGTLTIA